jgi:hypothetical protein
VVLLLKAWIVDEQPNDDIPARTVRISAGGLGRVDAVPIDCSSREVGTISTQDQLVKSPAGVVAKLLAPVEAVPTTSTHRSQKEASAFLEELLNPLESQGIELDPGVALHITSTRCVDEVKGGGCRSRAAKVLYPSGKALLVDEQVIDMPLHSPSASAVTKLASA